MSVRGKKTISDTVLSYKLYCSLLGGFMNIPADAGDVVSKGQMLLEMDPDYCDIPDDVICSWADIILRKEPQIRENPRNLILKDLSGKNAGNFALVYDGRPDDYVFGISLKELPKMQLRLRYHELTELFGPPTYIRSLEMKINKIYEEMYAADSFGQTWDKVDKNKKFCKPYLDVIEEFLITKAEHGEDIVTTLMKELSCGMDFYSLAYKKNLGASAAAINFSGNLTAHCQWHIPAMETNNRLKKIERKSDTALIATFEKDWFFEFRVLNTSKKITQNSLALGISCNRIDLYS